MLPRPTESEMHDMRNSTGLPQVSRCCWPSSFCWKGDEWIVEYFLACQSAIQHQVNNQLYILYRDFCRAEDVGTAGRDSGRLFILLNGRAFARDVVVVQHERRIGYAAPVFLAHVLLIVCEMNEFKIVKNTTRSLQTRKVEWTSKMNPGGPFICQPHNQSNSVSPIRILLPLRTASNGSFFHIAIRNNHQKFKPQNRDVALHRYYVSDTLRISWWGDEYKEKLSKNPSTLPHFFFKLKTAQ